MSTAAQNMPGRRGAWYRWIVHRRLWFTAGMVITCLITIVNGEYLPFWLTHVVIFTWVGASVLGILHQQGLVGNNCIECMYRRPDDGAQRALKMPWTLWLQHKPFLKVLITFGAIIGFGQVSKISFGLGMALYAVVFGLDDLLIYRHHQLQPWCPWCKHEGDGDHSHSTTPDPSMTKVTS